MVVHPLLHKPCVRRKWAIKQEYKESMNFVLVIPQHNKLWVILLDKDSHVPKTTKSNRNNSPHRDFTTLRRIHENKGDTSRLRITLVQLQACQHSQKSQGNITWPVVNIKRVHLSKIVPAVKYLNTIDKFKNCHVKTQKVLNVQSYRCACPLRILTIE